MILIAAMIIPVVQFHVQTKRNLRRAERFDKKYPEWTRAVALAGGPKRPKEHKGAVGRWRKAVRALWAGDNIYRKKSELESEESNTQSRVWLHPNMPFTVMLMTPFAYLPVEVMAITWNILKLIALVAIILMLARITAHKNQLVPDWVIALGLLWSLPMMAGDILHGNTNIFVLAVVILHLWSYRRGQDLWAGASLAVAICLKMTPAIFLLYWVYQRNWKLVASAMVALVIFAMIIPAVALGPHHCATLTQSWGENLIVPGLLKGAWYPIHVNQSISGVFSRYFLDGPNGDIFWNPDDNPHEAQEVSGWITLVALTGQQVKTLLRVCQVLVIALIAWAIGWKKLQRDDGRRALHYGLVAIALLLLNQRTWDHHAVLLVIADIAIWEGIAFGRFGRRLRALVLGMMIAAGLAMLGDKTSLSEGLARAFGQSKDAAEIFADKVKAYAPMFYHFLILLVTGALLVRVLRKSDPPYAVQRQKLSR